MDTRSLTVLYDDACGFCCECAAWFAQQPLEVRTTFIPKGSEQGQLIAGLVRSARHTLGREAIHDELVVIDSQSGVYEGPQAFIMCLWTLSEYTRWSYRLATPRMLPFARRFFVALSKNRKHLSALLGLQAEHPDAQAMLSSLLPDEPIGCARSSP